MPCRGLFQLKSRPRIGGTHCQGKMDVSGTDGHQDLLSCVFAAKKDHAFCHRCFNFDLDKE